MTDKIQLFTTCPPSNPGSAEEYVRQVGRVARWSEEAGASGILVYTDNGLLEPWAVSQIILRETERLAPLVALQPVYMHPFTTAKKVATLTYLYNRRLYINLVAGGFKNDLAALCDPTPHDERYARLIEYTTIVQKLLAGGPVSFKGAFYSVERLALTPAMPAEKQPMFLISGSSDAGLAAARALGALPVRYPEPPGTCVPPPDLAGRAGIRVGIIARDDAEEAWHIAEQRFPIDREGQLKHRLAMKTSDSVWHRTLSGIDRTPDRSVYWLVPFENYKTFCPYLVGDHRQVAVELRRYLEAGYRTFVTDVPAEEGDLGHINRAFALALAAPDATAATS